MSYPCRLLYDEDLSDMFHWKYTQFSQFNSDNTLIMVSGVHVGPNSTSGEIAVFALKRKTSGLPFFLRLLSATVL